MTIGYEGLSLEEFFGLLREGRVERIVDVRQMPLSRKKGFSKNSLREAACARGFEYIHLSAFGCPKSIRDTYKADGDWARYTRSFLAYLVTQQEPLQHLAQIASSKRCCLLCFEADPDTCHRLFVAEHAARSSGGRLRVHHLGAAFTAPALAA
ncbi:DUF488 family protein [Armatimonas rosea]|nr:DUF488 domain-containing protein [Armatimonas rosea]